MEFKVGDVVEVYQSRYFPEQNGLCGIVCIIDSNGWVYVDYDKASADRWGIATNGYLPADLRLKKPHSVMEDTRAYLDLISEGVK